MNTDTLSHRSTSYRSTLGTLISGSLAALAVASTLLFVKVGVASADVMPQITISYQDLDLSRAHDVQTLYRRLQKATRTVCEEPSSPHELARYAVYERCYNAVLDAAVMRVNAPQLVALHRAQSQSWGQG